MFSSISEEAFKRAFARDDDRCSFTLTVGSNVTTVVPCAYVEWQQKCTAGRIPTNTRCEL